MKGFLLILEYNIKKIGARLKAERKLAGFKSMDTLGEYIREYNYRGVTRQTIAKWENGEEMPPLDVLLNLCVPFQCGLGYLLCEYDYKTRINADIGEVTGLSEKAISILSQWKKIGGLPGKDYTWARNSTQAINDLIEQELRFSHDVLNPIAEYCCYRKVYATKNISDKTRTQALNKYRLALFTAANGLTDCIKAIYAKQAHDTN